MSRHVRVEFEVPEDLIDPSVSDADLARAAKEDFVLRLFRERRLSSGGAAEVLGITRRDFLDLLAARGSPYLDLTANELDEEIEAGRALARSARS
ncbi:MAG: UPF0175 family protein [Deltaproteobacteria bacterium]|nr:UPF0175 family protein [Deltaproteobacteria bacterium]